jgi:hypothetical protein
MPRANSFYLPELDGLRFFAFLAVSSITAAPRTLHCSLTPGIFSP